MTTIKGDLTKIEKGYIFQCVNCKSAMGAGLAKSLYTKWPEIKERYHHYCSVKKPLDILGEWLVVDVGKDLNVVNIFGQLNYGNDGKRYADYGAIKIALSSFLDWMLHWGNPELPVYFSSNFAAGLAGGDPEIIHQIIEMYFEDAILVEYE